MTGQVIVDISMSLDGYVTAAGVDLRHGLGVDGEPLHDWVFNHAPANRKVLGGEICHEFLAAGLVELVDSVSAPSAEHLSYKVIAQSAAVGGEALISRPGGGRVRPGGAAS